MKFLALSAPIAMLLGSTVLAQTTGEATLYATGNAQVAEGAVGATGTAEVGPTYGTDWPSSVGSLFFSDADRKTLRSREEIAQGWQSLSQEERAMVLAECERFSAETNAGGHSDTTATGAVGAGGDAAMVGTGDGAAGSGDATEVGGAMVGYDLNAMMVICPAIIDL